MDGLAAVQIFTVFAIVSGTSGQTVTVSVSAETVAAGTDVSLTCTVNGGPVNENNIQWYDVTEDASVNIFNGRNPFSVSPKYNNFNVTSLSGTESVMTIHNVEVEDDGNYRCSIPTDSDASPVNLSVEAPATVTSSLTSSVTINEDVYEATCDADGSKPQVTITWILNRVPQNNGNGNTIVETNPQEPDDPPLSNARSVFTFPATQENYGQTLVCQTSGHQLTELTRQDSIDLNIHSSPSAASTTVTSNYVIQGTGIRVSCTAMNEPEPVMRNYYIFSNGTLIHESMGRVSEVTVSDPEVGTEYTCMAGNYLGNTSLSATVIYDPTRTTIPPTTGTTNPPSTIGTTIPPTTDPSLATTESEEGTTIPPPTIGKPCTCMSTGASAGIAILALLLVASLITNIFQALLLRRLNTKSVLEESKIIEKRDGRNISHEANDNVAYEMIQSGDRAYTALKLGPKHTPIIDHENVTFFTRLGSIGRGDFGEVWKGDFRSNQSHVDVAIRLMPDHVTKSTNILRAVKVLYQLSDQPNIVKCFGYCQEKGNILYEFVSGGTLLTHLQTAGQQSQPKYNNLKPNVVRVDQDSLLNLAWQVAKGMQFLASKKIIHGSLCAHNVLLTDRKQCKLSDYGLSSLLFADQGKPTRWSPPETMVTYGQATEGDIWAFGIVLWEIVTLGVRPYPNMTFGTVQTEVSSGYKMPRPRHCGHEVYAVMNDCWEKEPRKRSSFDQILNSLERILEKTHSYLSLNDLDEGLYASTLDM